ncbi:MAG: hypothetical protein IJF84_00300 [Thermoguttaceae bacterium]|nr:hypothetical protein [Thermoguttaceae bacterium]
MTSYNISYSYLTYGLIDIDAKSKEEAEEKFYQLVIKQKLKDSGAVESCDEAQLLHISDVKEEEIP